MARRPIIAPQVRSGMVQLADDDGLLFRKKMLDVGEINYQGKRYLYDADYHQRLSDAFKAGTFPMVPFLLDGPHRHGVQADDGSLYDPDRMRGELVDLEFDPDGEDGPGTYGTVKFHTRKAAKLVRRAPKLAVSLSMVPDVVRADGRRAKWAVRHALATFDPHVAVSGGWKAVSLSPNDEPQRVVDLSAATIREIRMPKTKNKAKAVDFDNDDLAVVTDEEIEAALAEALAGLTPQELGQLNADTSDDSDDDDDGDDGDGLDEQPTSADNAADDPRIELAYANASVARSESAQLRRDLAASRWEKEADDLISDGVPPAIVELAAADLSVPGSSAVELAAGDGTDALVHARATIRALLEQMRDTVDLSAPSGHGGVGRGDDQDAVALALTAWDNTTGKIR
jgi:hypothetical protein